MDTVIAKRIEYVSHILASVSDDMSYSLEVRTEARTLKSDFHRDIKSAIRNSLDWRSKQAILLPLEVVQRYDGKAEKLLERTQS